MDPRSDESLAAAAADGEPGALDALLERHQARIYRFGKRMCGNVEDARDVLQETLLTMARSIHSFRGASSMSTWLYTIARSFCIKKRRRSKFAPTEIRSLDALATDALEPQDEGLMPDAALAGKEIGDALETAIGLLDPDQREVLILRDIEGLTTPEVAKILGITVAAAKSRLHRARARLREHLGDHPEDEQRPQASEPGCGQPMGSPTPRLARNGVK
jgi:RNA polymerase sigma-70 factor (ECF subfamily)